MTFRTWISSREAAKLLGIDRSRLCRIGSRIERKMKIIDGRANWLYNKAAVEDYKPLAGGRPRKDKGEKDGTP